MRRLLAALLASVMLVGAADARVAVIAARQVTGADGGADGAVETNNALARDMRLLRQVLASMNSVEGRDFVVVPPNIFKTEWVRTGLIQWPNGTTEQFDGIIVPTYPGMYRSSASTTIYPSIAFDSLTRVRYNGGNDSAGVLVPHLYLLTNSTGLRKAANDYLSSATAALACSVGVANGAAATNPLNQAQSFYMTERPSVRWQPHTYTAGWPITDTAIPGGIRKLLQASSSGYNILREKTGLVNSQWPDSLPFYSADNETTLVWDRLWANPTSYKATYRAKTQTFCMYYGGGLSYDSLSNNGVVGYRNSNNEGDLSVLRFGLAHFDSLIGGLLFRGDAAVRGIVVAHANGRGLRRWMGGIAPGDTASYYASLDSLRAWGVPITFGVNVSSDSATTYARDIIKLKSLPMARFTPYSTIGVFDTSATTIGAGIGATTNARWVDPWGRWRRRTFVGDLGNWADTSIATMARRQIAACDSIFSRPTVRVMVPPYDDWSPGVWGETTPYIAKRQSRIYADSMMYALRLGGFLGVLANGRSDECNLSVSSGIGYTNPRGFLSRQGWYRPKFNGTTTDGSTGIVSYAGATMDPFMVLTHDGTSMGLGHTQEVLFNDSTTAKTEGSVQYIYQTLDRANGGFWTRQWSNADQWRDFGTDYGSSNFYSWLGVAFPHDDLLNRPTAGGAYVLKLHASDLSGATSNTARCGLHVIRTLNQSFYATNLAAGRTLVRLGYLDEVRP